MYRNERAARRAHEAIQAYRKMRTARKAAEVPVAVGLIATGIYMGAVAVAKALEIEAAVTPDWCIGIATGIYGLYRGFRNWQKNRDRKD